MQLSKRTAYLAMYCFIDKFWWEIQERFQPSKLDDLAGFLGDMNPYLFKDSFSADPALWNDWEKVFEKMKPNETNNLTLGDVFHAMYTFVKFYYQRGLNDLDFLLSELQEIDDKNTGNFMSWHDWLECANRASA